VKLIPLGDADVPVCEGDVCEIPSQLIEPVEISPTTT
jgi:hypothetical protein